MIRRSIICLLGSILLAPASSSENTQTNRPQKVQPLATIAYTVSRDRKIYEIDLTTGQLIRSSKTINELGHPSGIDIDPSNRHLYIGSEVDHNLKHNEAIVEIDPANHHFKLVRAMLSGPNNELADSISKMSYKMNNAISVYTLQVSPNGQSLLVGDAINSDKGVLTIIDLKTGKTTGWTNLVIGGQYLTSPDNKKVAVMWPSGQRTDLIDGQQQVRSWKGGIAVGDLLTQKWQPTKKLTNNQGLQPPWAKLTSPFIYLRTADQHLLAYQRDTGQVLSDIDLPQLTQCRSTQTYPTLLNNPNQVALAMSCSDKEGVVIVIDVIEKKVRHIIKVGPYPTNVVVASSKNGE